MTGDWRDFRPAIWLAMLGAAVALVFSPWWFGAIFWGAAIGIAIRVQQRRRRLAAGNTAKASPAPRATRKRRSTGSRKR